MDIKKYTAYFHDGGFLLAKREGEKLEIWLASSEIELDWMDGCRSFNTFEIKLDSWKINSFWS